MGLQLDSQKSYQIDSQEGSQLDSQEIYQLDSQEGDQLDSQEYFPQDYLLMMKLNLSSWKTFHENLETCQGCVHHVVERVGCHLMMSWKESAQEHQENN